MPNANKGGAKQNSGWKVVNGIGQLPNGKMIAVESDGIPLIVSRVNNQLYAYRNLCPACERPFTNGTIHENILACQLGHRFDVQHAGTCTDDNELHLEPFPLLEENGIAKLAVG